MKKCLLFFTLIFSSMVYAQDIQIIPQPQKVRAGNGSFAISSKTVIVSKDRKDKRSIDFFNHYLQQFYGFSLQVKNAASTNYISFQTKRFITKPANEGHYTLDVTPRRIVIDGDADVANFYAVQTLIQLLPVERKKTLSIPVVAVEDEPRFGYRGMHLDVGRHFFPVEFIKKYIDFIALHKMNTFHWHLTEDQGWRIEIKKYPNLTVKGAYRNGTIIGHYPGTGNTAQYYGGYYTQEQVKEVVRYAADRFITVIPEIEMPGHSSAAIAAYPQLSCFPDESTKHSPKCVWNGDSTGKQVQQTWGVFEDVYCAGKENTFHFLEDVLDEVMQLFPSKYIHIGGDECPKANWHRCPLCQQRMRDNNLKDEHALQSYFIQRIEKYLNSKGRQIIGWDEILEGGLAPNATVMSWRGEKGGIEAAQQKHTVVMTPGEWCYFDHSQVKNEDSVTIGGYTSVEKVYSYEPVPAQLSEQQSQLVWGAQGNVWTEYMNNVSKVEYMIFPRMSALSEVLWTNKENKNWNDFDKRLQTQFKRYDLWECNYSKAYLKK
ncbi:MAG: beta-N-acetylhexosaminidase [Bacteroidota bacterium]|nr:beta-N-acetylhexosaminidase [Bacteroidota bacterium]